MSTSGESDRRLRIDELWSALVPKAANGQASNRRHDAVTALENASVILKSKDVDEDGRKSAAAYMLALFQLLSDDLLGDLTGLLVPSSGDLREDGLRARAEAIIACFYADHCIQPQLRSDLKTIMVPLNWTCLEQIRSGLEALNLGETTPVFEPSFTKRHGEAWSWDQARIAAVEHVMFLNGQGISKKKAREIVAKATGCVDAKTLKSWEERDLNLHYPKPLFEIAKKAGSFYRSIENDPETWTAARPADAHVVHKMRMLKGQLGAFGRSYEQDFGDRYRSDP